MSFLHAPHYVPMPSHRQVRLCVIATLTILSESLLSALTMQSPPFKPKNFCERRSLIHVTSPFYDSNGGQFFPLGVNQWASLVSIQTARNKYNAKGAGNCGRRVFDTVILVCAPLEAELSVLGGTLAGYCDHLVGLPRSTSNFFPSNYNLTALPFLQDIVNASIVASPRDDHYIIFSNSDICPSEDFYGFLERFLKDEQHVEAMAINRVTIPVDTLSWPPIVNYTNGAQHTAVLDIVQQSHVVLKSGLGNPHPGYDCFLFHSSLLAKINFGELFIGYPPWGANVVLALKIMAKEFRILEASQHGTFHLGDDMKWMSKSNFHTPNWSSDEIENIKWCPIVAGIPRNAHTLLNCISCGKLFRPVEKVGLTPSFVKPGHETLYLDSVETVMEVEHALKCGSAYIIRNSIACAESLEVNHPSAPEGMSLGSIGRNSKMEAPV